MFGNDTGRSDEYVLDCAAKFITVQLETLLTPLKFNNEAKEILKEYYDDAARVYNDEKIAMNHLFISFCSVISEGETKEAIIEYQDELLKSIQHYILPILLHRYANIYGEDDDQPNI